MFSLSLSPSLSDDAAAAAPLAVHRVWPRRQSSKQLYRAQLVRTDMIVHLPSNSLLYCFKLFLRGFKKPPPSLKELMAVSSLARTLFSWDEDFALAKEERRRNLGFVVYTR